MNAKNDATVIFVNVFLIDTLLYLTLSLFFLLWSANGLSVNCLSEVSNGVIVLLET